MIYAFIGFVLLLHGWHSYKQHRLAGESSADAAGDAIIGTAEWAFIVYAVTLIALVVVVLVGVQLGWWS